MRDPDLALVESMRAPPLLDDARHSLEYWERRRRTLPVYRRAARREAREMATRWEDRVHAARIARFEASPAGRFLAMLGISTAWLQRARLSKRGVLTFAWMVVPPKFKLVAGAVLAAWLVTALAVLAFAVAVFVQLLGW